LEIEKTISDVKPAVKDSVIINMKDPNAKTEEATGAEIAEQAAEILQPAPTAGEAMESGEEGTTEG
jgi:hypothetical protein